MDISSPQGSTDFPTSKLCSKFATQRHARNHIYYVAALPCKTQISKNEQCLQMGRKSSYKILTRLTEILSMSVKKCQKGLHVM